MTDESEGFSTRAIRAASRSPRVVQRPTSVPIYQTATTFGHSTRGPGSRTADSPTRHRAAGRHSRPGMARSSDARSRRPGRRSHRPVRPTRPADRHSLWRHSSCRRDRSRRARARPRVLRDVGQPDDLSGGSSSARRTSSTTPSLRRTSVAAARAGLGPARAGRGLSDTAGPSGRLSHPVRSARPATRPRKPPRRGPERLESRRAPGCASGACSRRSTSRSSRSSAWRSSPRSA